MKRLIVLAVLALAACSSSHGSGDPATTSPRDTYLQLVQPHMPHGWTDRRLIWAGHVVCRNIRHGEDFQTITSEFTGSGISVSDAGYVMGVAVHTFCPQLSKRLLNSAGG